MKFAIFGNTYQAKKSSHALRLMHSEALEDDKNENKLQCKKQDNSGFL